MARPDDRPRTLRTPAGELPLQESRLVAAGREWAVLHTGAVLTHEDEARVIGEPRDRLPYGVALWPAAIALAHEVAARADAFRGRRVLELGAGTGLPGLVAAAHGGQVVQTDRDGLALAVCRLNGERNDARAIEHRLADWADWGDAGRYDWILGADITYAEAAHPHLRRIFESNLAPGGRALLADPFRGASLRLLEGLEAAGWAIAISKWQVGEEAEMRPVGLFELTPPR